MSDARRSPNGTGLDLHTKILSFLMGEFARKKARQCVKVSLVYAPGGGYQDEEIRSWEREKDPELFDTFAHLEQTVSLIVEIAENKVDYLPAGKHRFVVRTYQHLGGRAHRSFWLSPRHVRETREVAKTNGDDLRLRIVCATLTGAAATRPENGSFAAHHEQLVANAFDLADGVLKRLALKDKKGALRPLHTILGLDADSISERDWYVATTVVQWLATNVGQSILSDAGCEHTPPRERTLPKKDAP